MSTGNGETSAPRRVVLSPDLVGRALFEAPAAGVLRLWRNGQLRPVVNRVLLVRYFRVLRALGLDEQLVRRWGWWFTAPTTAWWTEDMPPSELSLADVCNELARTSGADGIVHGGLVVPPASSTRWFSPVEFLREWKSD